MVELDELIIKDEMELKPTLLMESDTEPQNFEFSDAEGLELVSDAFRSEEALCEEKLPSGLSFGGIIRCTELKLIRSRSNLAWQEQHAGAIQKEAQKIIPVSVDEVLERKRKREENGEPPRPPRVKAPKRNNEELDAQDSGEEEDKNPSLIPTTIKTLANVLKMFLQPPWKIIESLTNLQVVHPFVIIYHSSKPGCTVTISLPAKLTIYINDQRMEEKHVFWKMCKEEKEIDGNLRINYILEVISNLIELGYMENPKKTLDALVSPPVPTEQVLPDVSITSCLDSNRTNKETMNKVLGLMNESLRDIIDGNSHEREMQFVKTYWSELMELLEERISHSGMSTMSFFKVKTRYERSTSILKKWCEIVKNNPQVLPDVLPQEIEPEWNPYCLTDEYTLRQELKRNARKMRTLRLYVKTSCDNFWHNFLLTNPKLNYVCT